MRLGLNPLIAATMLLFSCTGPRLTNQPSIRFPIAVECSIFSPSGELLWRRPQRVCNFLPDGSHIYSNDSSLFFIGANGKEIWQKPIHSHHEINTASNGDFLIISSEWFSVNSVKFKNFSDNNINTTERKEYESLPSSWKEMRFRQDKLIRISPKGVIVAERSFPHEFFSADNLVYSSAPTPDKYKLEISHFNSFYEIPTNASPLSAFHAGNFLVNDTQNGNIFVLDEKLEKELWHISYGTLGYETAHDVKVLPNGNLLIFVNRRKKGPPQSSLDEVDPVDGRLISQRSETGGFYARFMGSVQTWENGGLLFSAEKSGKPMVKALSQSGKIFFSLDLYSHFGRPVQGAYERPELEDFLAKAARP
jgi:hypothetical protein